MTKRRPPLSVEAALIRIIGQFDDAWSDASRVCDRQPGTVRAWADPDRPEQIPLDCAIALDLAYQQHGGIGAPLFECYAHLLEMAGIDRFADRIVLGRITGQSIIESAEAHAALVRVSQPDSTDDDRRRAANEVAEAIAILKHALPLLDDTPPAASQPP